MDLQPWTPPDIADLERLVTRADIRRIGHQEPLTVSQVLAKGYLAMEAEDQAETAAADPLIRLRALRQRTLWGRIIDSMTRRR